MIKLITILILLLVAAPASSAATFTVNSTLDTADALPGDGTCATAGAVCTLRAAIEESNAFIGADSIHFNIPGPGPHVIQPGVVTGVALPIITDPVIIDGYTQPGAQPNTVPAPGATDAILLIELDGTFAVGGHGLSIQAGSSTVRGLVINRFPGEGIDITSTSNNNTVEGNYIGMNAGGTAPLPNLLSGVRISGAGSNTVGGSTAGARNLISGNGQNAVFISGADAIGTVVRGNYMGTNANGTSGFGNTGWGMRISGSAPDTIVGGTGAGEGNIFSDNGSGGIRLNGPSATGTIIHGNLIGTDAAGTGNLGNTGPGVQLDGEAWDTTIGGIGLGEANTIAFNGGDGVTVHDPGGGASTPSYNNPIRGNSIHSNGGLGIDLDDDDVVTGNDPAPDNDDGANKLQNFPVLAAAASSGGSTTVTGTLTSALSTTYDIDFYSNPAADVPTGYGEGEVYLGSDSVTTDGITGVAAINKTLPVAVTVGHVVTATATDPDGNTSEFSQAVAVDAGLSISGTVYHDANANGNRDGGEQGIGTVWVKLVQGGSVLQTAQADPDTGAYELTNVADGSYDVIVDDNNNTADATPTAPVNWSFGTPATGLLSVAVAGADVTDQDLGLTFDFDLAADCACDYEDGLFTQVAITVDGNMADWAAVFSDGDNNACDATDATDRDHTVQSTGRNLLRTAVTWDATYFSMWTQRVGSSNNTQNFIYYADTNVDGIQQNGEPVVVAKWQGNTGTVVFELYTYNDLGSGGDPVLDTNGFADGYSMPGDLVFVKTLTMPDGAGQGSTSGSSDGTQMEWSIEWTELGVPAGSAIGWHVSSTNVNPASAGLSAQIDDNLGGCGGQCTGSNQFAGIAPTPIASGGGDIVYASHTFTNTGNGPDLFDFTWFWTGDFAPVSVTFYEDLGTVGEFDPGVDVLLTDTDGDAVPDTGNMAAGATFELLIAIELPDPPAAGTAIVTTVATSNFLPGCGGTVTPVSGSVNNPLFLSLDTFKRAFQVDGTPIADLATVPAGLLVKFLIYVTNYGGVLSDMSLRDVLDPAFDYQAATMKVDNTLLASVVCPGAVCDEMAIFSQVDGSGTAVGDGDAVTAPIDADEASYDSATTTLDLGDQNNVNNAQLDLAADSVWALVYTIRMQ